MKWIVHEHQHTTRRRPQTPLTMDRGGLNQDGLLLGWVSVHSARPSYCCHGLIQEGRERKKNGYTVDRDWREGKTLTTQRESCGNLGKINSFFFLNKASFFPRCLPFYRSPRAINMTSEWMKTWINHTLYINMPIDRHSLDYPSIRST